MADILTVLDFPGIKRFVFGTDAAREIRGASALLEEINQKHVPDLLEQAFGDRFQSVFFAGGAGMFMVKDSDLAEVDTACEKAAALVHERSAGGTHLVWSSVPMGDAFTQDVRKAHLLLGAKKGQIRFPMSTAGSALLAECDSCSAPGAVDWWREGDSQTEVEWLCHQCAVKRNHRKESKTWRDLAERLQSRPDALHPEDFTDLGRHCPRAGYLSLIYLDGDSMGRVVKSIPTPQAYTQFSEVVDSSIRQATYEAVETYANPGHGSNASLICDILLLGGDDLVMVVPANLALPMAISITGRFQELTKEKFSACDFPDTTSRKQGLTVSAGIAVFKQRQPFRVVLDQAEQLLNSAKRKRSEDGVHEAYIDWADVSQTRFVNLDDLRTCELGVGSEVEMTMWPMSAHKARKFLDSIQHLLEKKVPKGRVRALGSRAVSGRNVSFESMRILARTGKKEHREALLAFFEDNGMWPLVPWAMQDNGPRRTSVVDLMHLYPLMAQRDAGHAGEARS